MIHFYNKRKIVEIKELEKASENLPENILIGANFTPLYSFQIMDMDFFFIPYTVEEQTQVSDILFYNNASLSYGDLSDTLEPTDFDELGKFYMNKIPSKYKFVDLYLNNFNPNERPVKEFNISFLNMENKTELFSYSYSESVFDNIWIGTFAQVSNGWKFYPKFIPYDENINNIIGTRYNT